MQPPLSELVDWSDDDLIGRLYAPLPPSRDVYPTRWDANIKFWKKAFAALCFSRGDVFIKSTDSLAFKTAKGLVPQDFDRIITELSASGAISVVDSSSLLWRLFDGLVLSPLSGRDRDRADRYVNNDVIKAYAMSLIKWHERLVDEGKSFVGDVHTVGELMEITLTPEFEGVAGSCILQKNSWDSVLCEIEAMKAGKVVSSDHIKGVKFLGKGVATTAEEDVTLLHLKSTLFDLHRDQERLENQADGCREAALNSVRKGNRDIAKMHVKRRKMLLDAVQKRAESSHRIESVMLSVETAQTQVRAQAAIKAGTIAMKQLLPELETIHDTISDVSEVMADLDTIDLGIGVDDDDLERELDELVGHGVSQRLNSLGPTPISAPISTPISAPISAKRRLLA